jgi:hypothetical protein
VPVLKWQIPNIITINPANIKLSKNKPIKLKKNAEHIVFITDDLL